MRRVSTVFVLAAAITVGHLGYHLLPRPARQPAAPPAPPPAVIEATPPATVEAAPPASAPCSAYAPIKPAEWKLMSASLRPLVENAARRDPSWAKYDWEFFRRFELCGVDIRERPNYLLAMTPFGGFWQGARFRKTNHGWIALQLDGGDIR